MDCKACEFWGLTIQRYHLLEIEPFCPEHRQPRARLIARYSPRVMAKAEPGVVYFVQGCDGGPIKIGFTRDIEKRLATLQTAAARPLVVLGYVRAAPAFERHLHRKFSEIQLHGEWFEPSPDLLAMIDRFRQRKAA